MVSVESIKDIPQQVTSQYHKAMANLAIRRMESAGHILEKMDHKDALYHDLGQVALGQNLVPTPTSHRGDYNSQSGQFDFVPAKPRTRLERMVDRHLDKRAQKVEWANTRKYRFDKVFGPYEQESVLSVGEIILGHDPMVESLGRRSVLSSRLDEKIHGPKLEGFNKRDKKEFKRIVKEQTKDGEYTVREARRARIEIDALPYQKGRSTYVPVINEVRSKGSALRSSIRHIYTNDPEPGQKWMLHQTVSSPAAFWRDKRRNRAVYRIIKNHDRMQRHGGLMSEVAYARRLR
jgi:hypothetical protein